MIIPAPMIYVSVNKFTKEIAARIGTITKVKAMNNELSSIFGKLGIPTPKVLEASKTKRNFLPFEPGLVGGHCIGVDPYHLTHKDQMIDFHPDMILAGRRTNDKVAFRVGDEVILSLSKRRKSSVYNRVLIKGFTFKEDCLDIRNTKVFDIVRRLRSCDCDVEIHDPVVDQIKPNRDMALEYQRHA